MDCKTLLALVDTVILISSTAIVIKLKQCTTTERARLSLMYCWSMNWHNNPILSTVISKNIVDIEKLLKIFKISKCNTRLSKNRIIFWKTFIDFLSFLAWTIVTWNIFLDLWLRLIIPDKKKFFWERFIDYFKIYFFIL